MDSNPNGALVAMPISALRRRLRPNFTKEFEEEKKRLPTPSHRHAAPSAPWPWVDIHDGVFVLHLVSIHTLVINRSVLCCSEIDPEQLESEEPPVPDLCDHTTCSQRGGCWREYPQSRFPNWTATQVEKSKISDAIANYNKDVSCKIYHVDVNNRGLFTSPGIAVMGEGKENESWNYINHTDVCPIYSSWLLSALLELK
ncbi:hypothetical protein C0995_013477 [Termitomyces sp. Mi166|nr:hypothetical protein C0995_013477 [Termitomyces sp. Mi166\